MIKFKYHNEGSNMLFQIVILWVFGFSIHWYVSKGDHTELSLSLGPIDIRFGTSIWWNKLTP